MLNDVVLVSAVLCLVTQSCPTFCNPVDCNLPGSSAHGILQARILEWVTISSSRGSLDSLKHWHFLLALLYVCTVHLSFLATAFLLSINHYSFKPCWDSASALSGLTVAWRQMNKH